MPGFEMHPKSLSELFGSHHLDSSAFYLNFLSPCAGSIFCLMFSIEVLLQSGVCGVCFPLYFSSAYGFINAKTDRDCIFTFLYASQSIYAYHCLALAIKYFAKSLPIGRLSGIFRFY